jgi:hypothetical protein
MTNREFDKNIDEIFHDLKEDKYESNSSENITENPNVSIFIEDEFDDALDAAKVSYDVVDAVYFERISYPIFKQIVLDSLNPGLFEWEPEPRETQLKKWIPLLRKFLKGKSTPIEKGKIAAIINFIFRARPGTSPNSLSYLSSFTRESGHFGAMLSFDLNNNPFFDTFDETYLVSSLLTQSQTESKIFVMCDQDSRGWSYSPNDIDDHIEVWPAIGVKESEKSAFVDGLDSKKYVHEDNRDLVDENISTVSPLYETADYSYFPIGHCEIPGVSIPRKAINSGKNGSYAVVDHFDGVTVDSVQEIRRRRNLKREHFLSYDNVLLEDISIQDPDSRITEDIEERLTTTDDGTEIDAIDAITAIIKQNDVDTHELVRERHGPEYVSAVSELLIYKARQTRDPSECYKYAETIRDYFDESDIEPDSNRSLIEDFLEVMRLLNEDYRRENRLGSELDDERIQKIENIMYRVQQFVMRQSE